MSEESLIGLLTLEKQLINAVFQLKHLFTKLHMEADEKYGGYDVSMAELELMKEIRDNTLDAKKNACSADIQHHLHISKAGVSKMLGVLEEKGYINRDVDKNDRRNIIITLTEEGRNVVNILSKDSDEYFTKIIQQLGVPETNQFVQYVSKFVEVMGKEE